MVRRNEKYKQITVSLRTYKRFLEFSKYNENKEGILLRIMDLADKGRKFSSNIRGDSKL